MSWFTNGDLQQGIYYSRFSFDTKAPNTVTLIDGTAGAGHPHLASRNAVLHLVWKGFDGSRTLLNIIRSVDEGKSWSEPDTIFTTTEGSDHPLLVNHDSGVFLSWHSDEHGYIFEALDDSPRLSLTGED